MTKKKTLPSAHITDKELVWGIAYLLFNLFLLPSLLAALNDRLPMPMSSSWFNFLYFTLNLLFVLWIFHGYLGRSLAYAGAHFFRFLIAALCGVAGYLLANLGISFLFSCWFPDFANLNDSGIHAMVQENFWIMFIGTVLFVPVAEEVLYRGLVFGSLYQKSHIAAYLLSVVIFAAVHVVQYIGVYSPLHTALAFIQYIPAGFMLAFAYRISGSIFAPILAHAVINALSILQLS